MKKSTSSHSLPKKKGGTPGNSSAQIQQPVDKGPLCQWKKTTRELMEAPETNILYKETLHSHGANATCIYKLIKYLKAIFNRRVTAIYGLANFKPITARTNNTLEFVKQCSMKYSKSIPAKTVLLPPVATPVVQNKPVVSNSSMKSANKTLSASKVKKGDIPLTPSSSVSSNSSNKSQPKGGLQKVASTNSSAASSLTKIGPQSNKPQLFKQFYDLAHQALHHLQEGSNYYKEMILNLSFTRYAEYKLTTSEIKLTQGKSIIGSCMWVVTCALKQLQEDPAMEPFETLQHKNKPNSLIADLAADLLVLVNLSFDSWNENVEALTILERIHLKTEDIFKKQTSIFHTTAPPDSVQAITAGVHLKKYRRLKGESKGIRRLGSKSMRASGSPWSRSQTYPRVLFRTDYIRSDSKWKGFDPIPVNQKVAYIKEVLRFIQLILQSVKDAAHKVSIELQGIGQGQACYEKGIDAMAELLKNNLAHVDWTSVETQDFFEMDKIFLDDIDLLTMGAGLTRTILHDARHMLHICYETIRLLNFKEFVSMPEYGRIQRMYYKTKDEQMKPKDHRMDILSLKSTKSINTFDIEETQLDIRNLNTLFRFSPYYEVAKTLPVYCMKVGLTIQDTDLVFTPSSERFLTLAKPLVGLGSN